MMPSDPQPTLAQETKVAEFREDTFIPDDYLGNLFIFFILFIGLSLLVIRFGKGKLSLLVSSRFGNRKTDDLVKRTEKLSARTQLHFIEYKGNSIVVAESHSGVSIQVLPARSETQSFGDSSIDLPEPK